MEFIMSEDKKKPINNNEKYNPKNHKILVGQKVGLPLTYLYDCFKIDTVNKVYFFNYQKNSY